MVWKFSEGGLFNWGRRIDPACEDKKGNLEKTTMPLTSQKVLSVCGSSSYLQETCLFFELLKFEWSSGQNIAGLYVVRLLIVIQSKILNQSKSILDILGY